MAQWDKLELNFTSSEDYINPLYEVREFYAVFTSPTRRELRVNGFWDGDRSWKIRFLPDETGTWTYRTVCSRKQNAGLHEKEGAVNCIRNTRDPALFRKGSLQHQPGDYHLSHADGTPFFWTACTAWNGALFSTEEEWDTYLRQRRANNYNVIQLVTTEWRGAATNAEGQTAIEGSGRIRLNPDFFERMDQRMDRVNELGLVAAPVILWALPFGDGREISPGYRLPVEEAVLLAKYIVARYGAHHVVWLLGGDGDYLGYHEDRWKTIGRRVFGDIHHAPASLHPKGRSWIGEAYRDEEWMDVVGYQSTHGNTQPHVDFINRGELAGQWAKLPARPLINMEPNYEQIRNLITAEDVRNASYWSVFATPPAGITYGANGVWPWLREGDTIQNHRDTPGTDPWYEGIELPGSLQIGFLAEFMQSLSWWTLRPDTELLVEQPGDSAFNHFVGVLRNPDYRIILAYVPRGDSLWLRNPLGRNYRARWFDPRENSYRSAELKEKHGGLRFTPPDRQDYVLILEAD